MTKRAFLIGALCFLALGAQNRPSKAEIVASIDKAAKDGFRFNFVLPDDSAYKHCRAVMGDDPSCELSRTVYNEASASGTATAKTPTGCQQAQRLYAVFSSQALAYFTQAFYYSIRCSLGNINACTMAEDAQVSGTYYTNLAGQMSITMNNLCSKGI